MDSHKIPRPRTVTMPNVHIAIRPAVLGDHERIAILARETFADKLGSGGALCTLATRSKPLIVLDVPLVAAQDQVPSLTPISSTHLNF